MKNKQILSALSLDLKRTALGLHNGSIIMAEKFKNEALKRKAETDLKSLKPYMQEILNKTEKSLNSPYLNSEKDNLLMYSILIQNYTLLLDR